MQEYLINRIFKSGCQQTTGYGKQTTGMNGELLAHVRRQRLWPSETVACGGEEIESGEG